jgi:hypothetical protein
MESIIDKLNLLNSPDYETARRTLEFFYEGLSVLDHKAEALMVFDGILIAAATLTVDKGGLTAIHRWRRALVVVVMVLALLAAGACLFIARVKYAFLGDIQIVNGKLQLDSEMRDLAAALADRTSDYQIAWYLSVGAVCLSILIAASVFFIPIRTAEPEKED